MTTKYLHTMIRVHDLEKTVDWFKTYLGLEETRRYIQVEAEELAGVHGMAALVRAAFAAR